MAAGGRKVLLVEVEGRQGIAQLFDVPPLPYKEVKIATAEGGGQVNALAIDTEAAFLEYLDMFYNLGIAGRAMRRIGAVEFATTIAPGLRDVLLTGKIKRDRRPQREGQAGRVRRGRRRLAADRTHRPLPRRHARPSPIWPRAGRCIGQADGVVKLLHSELTAIHLVTLLEALPIQETVEAIDELKGLGLPIGSVIVNRNIPTYLAPADLAKAAEGDVDADAVRAGLTKAGITLSRQRLRRTARPRPSSTRRASPPAPRAPNNSTSSTSRGSNCPRIRDGVDLGSLYELAEELGAQGVR